MGTLLHGTRSHYFTSIFLENTFAVKYRTNINNSRPTTTPSLDRHYWQRDIDRTSRVFFSIHFSCLFRVQTTTVERVKNISYTILALFARPYLISTRRPMSVKGARPQLFVPFMENNICTSQKITKKKVIKILIIIIIIVRLISHVCKT